MRKTRFIAYYRVSTSRQGVSGLGLEAQEHAAREHVTRIGGQILEAFTEVESGGRDDRPELAKALAACRKHKATLLVAKLDRLTRDTRFFLTLYDGAGDGGVAFCDLPEVPPGPTGKFILTLLAAVAELERGFVSQRTRAALQAAKRRGVSLGRRPGADVSVATAALRKRAAQRHANVRPVIESIRQAGVTTLAGIAAALNARGIGTPRGGKWHARSVSRVLAA